MLDHEYTAAAREINLLESIIEKLRDELGKEKAIVDYFEDEKNWISHTKEVNGQTVYYFKPVIDMRKVAFHRQMARRKNI